MIDRIILNFFVDCEYCGNAISRRQIIKRGKTRGPLRGIRFCSRSCSNKGRKPPKGFVDKHGYRVLPTGGRGKPQVYEHRAVMENVLGRKLTKQETVHHKNGDRLDNSPSNLELWTGRHGRGVRAADIMSFVANDYVLGTLSLSA